MGMSQPNQQPDCETLRALIPAYCLGATDPEETALVERLLPLCPEAAAELDEYMAMTQAMLYTAPPAVPPAHLHDRIMAAAAPSAPRLVSRAVTQPSAQPSTSASLPTAAPRPRVGRVNRLIAGLAVAAAALLIISNVYWVNQVNSLNRQQQELVALMSDQENALASLGSGQAERVELVSTSGDQGGVLATVLWSPQSDTALLYTDTLPALASDQSYQLWLIGDAQPISAGVFHIGNDGKGTLIFHTDEPMTDFAAVAISTEPAGGSPAPTSDPIALAQI